MSALHPAKRQLIMCLLCTSPAGAVASGAESFMRRRYREPLGYRR